jgi:hypothetical protein
MERAKRASAAASSRGDRHLQDHKRRLDVDARLQARGPDRDDGRRSPNPDIAFAAVLGKAFGPNAQRGVYRTKDGGKTWVQVASVDADTSASDVAFDPSNPTSCSPASGRRAAPWSMTSGGPEARCRSRATEASTPGRSDEGLPEELGKVGVAVAT